MKIRDQFSLDLWPLNLVGWYGYRHFGCSIYLAWSALPVFALMWNICCLCQALKWKCLVCLPRWHFKKVILKRFPSSPPQHMTLFTLGWLPHHASLGLLAPCNILGYYQVPDLDMSLRLFCNKNSIMGCQTFGKTPESEWICTMKPGNATSIDLYLPHYVVIHINTHI